LTFWTFYVLLLSMGYTTSVKARIDSDEKNASEAILDSLGVSTSDAIRMYFSQIRLRKGIPFPITEDGLLPDYSCSHVVSPSVPSGADPEPDPIEPEPMQTLAPIGVPITSQDLASASISVTPLVDRVIATGTYKAGETYSIAHRAFSTAGARTDHFNARTWWQPEDRGFTWEMYAPVDYMSGYSDFAFTNLADYGNASISIRMHTGCEFKLNGDVVSFTYQPPAGTDGWIDTSNLGRIFGNWRNNEDNSKALTILLSHGTATGVSYDGRQILSFL
jgi:addiction module RelB/DinJ family antitoxin